MGRTSSAGRHSARTDIDWREDQRCVATGISVKPAANRVVHERPDSCNRNLPGTEKPPLLGQAGGEAAVVDSCPASATGISNTSREHGSSGEWLLLGVLTLGADQGGGCSVSKACVKRC